MSLAVIFHGAGGQFYLWRKAEYLEKTTDTDRWLPFLKIDFLKLTFTALFLVQNELKFKLQLHDND
jgi:hypothetical protein